MTEDLTELTDNDDELVFMSEDADIQTEEYLKWKILIVDDEPEIHNVTKLVLDNFSFKNRKLEIYSVYSKKDAEKLLKEQEDIALILLDVVMEEEDTGLQLVKFIREDIGNTLTRIILRTGQPGEVPEEEVILNYDINDYKAKTELTATRLYTTLITSLRTYENLLSLEKAQAELKIAHQKTQKMVSIQNYFLRNLSHELRTPLNGIMGFADLLNEQITDNELCSYISNIQQSGGRLMSTLNDLLDLAKIESGDQKILSQPISLKNLLNTILDELKGELNDLVSIEFNKITPEFSFNSNENTLYKSFRHILHNSHKFTLKGKIAITLQSFSSSEVVLLFEDTGIGIEQTFIPHIFDPFYQEDSNNNRNFEGVGIGLSIVKKFLDSIGSQIFLESKKGEGTKIILTIKNESLIL